MEKLRIAKEDTGYVLVHREDFNEIAEAMDTLSGCIASPVGGRTINGEEYVDFVSVESKEDVADAIKTITLAYKIKL